MMNSPKIRGFALCGALFAVASFGYARQAQASPAFPVALRDALQKRFPQTTFCVPLCTACHSLTTGGPGNYNNFGGALLGSGLQKADSSVDAALNKELDMKLDVDGDNVTDNDELAAGESPTVFGPAPFCPADSAQYGCGARIAAAPPPIDKVGLFSAGLVVFGLTVLRRRR